MKRKIYFSILLSAVAGLMTRSPEAKFEPVSGDFPLTPVKGAKLSRDTGLPEEAATSPGSIAVTSLFTE